MRKLVLLLGLLSIFLPACQKKPATRSRPDFTGDIRMLAPFVTEMPIMNGTLYMSQGKLRVDLGSMVDIYTIQQSKGWRTFPALRQYFEIGEKQVSTYLPRMTNGSPCPASQLPSACKMIAKDKIQGRSATKWELMNQHGERIYLWTDDKLEIAVRWDIENTTYQLINIREGAIADSMFELPAGYTRVADLYGLGK